VKIKELEMMYEYQDKAKGSASDIGQWTREERYWCIRRWKWRWCV